MILVKCGWLIKLARNLSGRKTNYIAVAEWLLYWPSKPGAVKRNHEEIHNRQQRWLLYVGMWVLYRFFYLCGLILYRNREKAYLNNPFEFEARSNEEDLNYLKKRRPYAWVRYICKK